MGSIAFVSISAVAAGMLAAGPATAATPGSPTGLASYPALHGVGLSWTGDFSAATPTSYTIYSRPDAGSGWTQIGTENASPTDHTGTYIDGTLSGGASAQYAVSESVGNNNESAKSAVITATRPATDPIAGSSNAITVDTGNDSTLSNEDFDSATNGSVTLTHDVLTGSGGGESATATIPMVAGPGTYTVGSAAVPLNITTDDATCTTETGTLTVIDVAYDLNLDPVLFSASYAISCDGGPTVYGDIRWHSTQIYRDLVVTPEVIDGVGVPVGQAGYVDVTISNVGTETAHDDAATITGPAAGDWQDAQPSGCFSRTFGADTSCTFELLFTPSESGHRSATLSFTDNSARGSHSISLDGIGELAPSAPPTTARLAVHQIQISWTAPDNGGAPITEYDVYKDPNPPNGQQQLVATITPKNPDVGGTYIETDVPTGATYEYDVVAVNAAGDSPDAAVTATTPSDEILIDGSTAITTAGDEPVTVATPAVAGRVAVVPGDNRIIYPATYAGGAVDLAVASPFGTLGQMRLTTMGATDPAVSADGSTVAFVHVSGSGQPSIWTVPISGGTATEVAAGYTNPSWLPSGRDLVAEPSSKEGTPTAGAALVELTLSGTATDIPGTTDGHEPAVSPDGNAIAYQLYNQGSGTYSLAVVPSEGGTAMSSSSTNNAIEDISWRTDSAELFAAVGGKVKQASYSAGTGPGALTTLSPPDVTGVRWPAYINSDAVSLLNPQPVTKKRASVAIATVTGATTTCRLDGGTATPCNNSWNSVVNLASGRHSLIVTSTPDTGIPSTVIWSFVVDVKDPTISLHHLAKKTHAEKVTIRYSGHDNDGIASYDVRYAKGSSKRTVGAYQYPHSWQETRRTSVTLKVHKGKTYCVSARSRDEADNVSKWSKERCIVAK